MVRFFSPKFDVFWSELAAYLDEAGLAVHERYSSKVRYMKFAISVSHLRNIIESHLKKNFLIQKFPFLG